MRVGIDSVTSALDMPYLSVNAWNESTEGSYREPETTTGLGYLDAVAEAIWTAPTTTDKLEG